MNNILFFSKILKLNKMYKFNRLPESVLWFEPPLVAHWISDKKIWSTQDIHDIKYNEEKQIITFRTGRLGIHGLAAFKFINLPFQSWELKPEAGKTGGVTLSISAAIVQVEFVVRVSLLIYNSIYYSNNKIIHFF